MKHLKRTASVFALAASVGFAGSALAQDIAGPEPYPIPVSMQEGDAALVDYDALIGLGGPTNFNEPEWVSELVAAGKIPPVEERIPAEPIVMKTESMPDGAGVYGGVFRHVSGGRPEGWNWMAGQHQGWGGLSKTSQMCLVRTGPMWILSPDKVEPLPRLATSWEWSEDGHQLTMDLIEGARWSDGDPFDADDIVFMWEDNIKDTGVPSRMQAEALGEGVELEVLGPYQIRWTFPDSEFSVPNLLKMSYISMCPGPSHILKPLHPAYNADATYDSYLNALPADALPWVTMGPWVATEYKPDEIMVFRRNPYFPVVDSDGNQLPYIDEMHFKLSTWEDRTIQTVAGSADFTNMENPSIYIESLKAAKEDGFPNFVYWGPRSLHWRLDMNLSTVCGVTSERDQAIRDLNRNLDFRRAVTHAVDREAAGQALVRGPFTHPFAGGLHTETEFFKPEMVVYYPYDVSSSKALLSGLGFEDSDGDGFVNWPDGGPLAGENLEVVMGYSSQRTTDTALADSLITMMQEVGIKAIG
ncbi:MAG: ABC transporter substrate-binding protein, partial [Pseudomonadota bacterium]